jgi:glutamate/aspartate transport system substrate-binding protein
MSGFALFGRLAVPWLLAPALIIPLLAAAVVAADPDTLFKIRRAGTIAIGYSEAAKPFSFLGPDGKPAGYSIDLCREIAAGVQRELNLSKLEIKWVKLPPDARISAVVSGRVDIECGSTTRTLSREAQVDFTNLIFVDGASLLVTESSGIKRPAHLAGKRIAVVQTTTTERVLAETLKRLSITDATLFAVKDHPEALTALENGKIDAYASDRVILAGLRTLARDPAKLVLLEDYLSYEPYAFVVRRNDSPFRLAVNRVLARLYRSAEVVPIYEKWFGPMPEGGLIPAVFALQSVPE